MGILDFWGCTQKNPGPTHTHLIQWVCLHIRLNNSYFLSYVMPKTGGPRAARKSHEPGTTNISVLSIPGNCTSVKRLVEIFIWQLIKKLRARVSLIIKQTSSLDSISALTTLHLQKYFPSLTAELWRPKIPEVHQANLPQNTFLNSLW